MVFGVLLFAIVVWGLVNYSGLGSDRDRRDSRQAALTAAEAQINSIDDDIADLFVQVEELNTRKNVLTTGSGTATFEASVVWETAIEVILGLDDEAVTVDSVVAEISGDVVVDGTTRDVSAMGELQSRLSQASDVVELVGFLWSEFEGQIVYTAQLRVLR